MAFIIEEVHGNIAADGVQLLAGRQIVFEVQVIPALPEDRCCTTRPGFLDGCGDNLRQELLGIDIIIYRRADCLEGMSQHVVCMTIATTGHHKPLACIVHYLGLTLFDKGFGSRLVANIDVFAILHGKGLYYLVILRCEYLTINHEIGTRLPHAAGKHAHADDDAHQHD